MRKWFPFFMSKNGYMGKIIGFTYDLKTDWQPGPDEPHDANAEFDSPAVVDRVIQAFEAGGHTVKRIGNFKNLLAQVDNLGVDIVFNICEGYGGRSRESQVQMLLEMKGIPCVGADALSQALTLDKVIAKKIFVADGIPTPKFFVADSTANIEKLNTIGYPLIVKTRHEGTSKGLTIDSRVENAQQLKKRVEIINTVYKQSALVEEFIKGTEFTVAVLGNENPEAMPVCQIAIDGKVDLGDKFYNYERLHDTNLRYVCPAKIPESLAKQLQELSIKAYKSVECRDFGRVDFRVDEAGRPYVLEINPLPSLNTQDVFNIFPQTIGTTFDAIINRIIDFALIRNGLIEKKNSIINNPNQLVNTR